MRSTWDQGSSMTLETWSNSQRSQFGYRGPDVTNDRGIRCGPGGSGVLWLPASAFPPPPPLTCSYEQSASTTTLTNITSLRRTVCLVFSFDDGSWNQDPVRASNMLMPGTEPALTSCATSSVSPPKYERVGETPRNCVMWVSKVVLRAFQVSPRSMAAAPSVFRRHDAFLVPAQA